MTKRFQYSKFFLLLVARRFTFHLLKCIFDFFFLLTRKSSICRDNWPHCITDEIIRTRWVESSKLQTICIFGTETQTQNQNQIQNNLSWIVSSSKYIALDFLILIFDAFLDDDKQKDGELDDWIIFWGNILTDLLL